MSKYIRFVRPRLEHAVAAWNPWLESDIRNLEKIQERLIRMLSDVRGETYSDKLRDAGLTTLKETRPTPISRVQDIHNYLMTIMIQNDLE